MGLKARSLLGETGADTMVGEGTVAHQQEDKFACAIMSRQNALLAERRELDSLYDLMARFAVPTSTSYQETTAAGFSRDRMILDSTAAQSLELFASSINGLMTNPGQEWFDLTYDTDRLVVDDYAPRTSDARLRWADAVSKRLFLVATTGIGNIYSALHQLYLDLGWRGTSCLYVEEDPHNFGGIRSYYIPLRDIVIDEGEHGRVDFVIRSARLTPRKARQRWKKAWLGKSIEKTLEDKSGKGMTDKRNFVHVCFPATDTELTALIPRHLIPRRAWSFVSAWINVEDRVTVAVTGYNTFPYMVPRWLKVGDVKYGRSPMMTVLGDVLMANRLAELMIRGNEKLVDPPLQIPHGGLVSPVRLWPGGFTFTDGDVKITPLIPPGASRVEFGEKLMQQRQDAIRKGFFTPLFQTPESPVQTATAVLQMTDERNRALSPMAFRLQGELLDPLISRIYDLQAQAKMIPPPPDAGAYTDIKVRYKSPILASIQQQEALATTRLFEMLQPWASIDPGVFDNFDPDLIAVSLHQSSGAPTAIRRDKNKVKALRKARDEQAQAQQAMQMIPEAASALAQTQTAQAAVIKANKK